MSTIETVLIPQSWRVTTSEGMHLGTVSHWEWRGQGVWIATWTPDGATGAELSEHDTQDEAVAAVVAGRAA
jgi:hypothetical protein